MLAFRRADRLRALAASLQIPLENVQRLTGKQPILRFHVGGDCIEIPQELCLEQRQFRRKMYALTGIPPRSVGSKEVPGWDHYLVVLADVAEEIDVGDDATLDGELEAMLRSFFSGRGCGPKPVGGGNSSRVTHIS